MYDFPGSEGLQRITREIYERGGIVSSVCHGYCGLLNTTLSDGSYLIAGRKLTVFAWLEERLARVDKLVPYNAEEKPKSAAHCTRKQHCRSSPTPSSTATSSPDRTQARRKKPRQKSPRSCDEASNLTSAGSEKG